jgi:hypothetical protein
MNFVQKLASTGRNAVGNVLNMSDAEILRIIRELWLKYVPAPEVGYEGKVEEKE